MRVTSKQMYADLLAGIQRQMTIQNEGQTSIASGKRFQKPAQASNDYKVSMDLRHSLTGVQGSFAAIKTAKTRLEFSQSILNTMKNIFSRAQTLAIQQSTNPNTSSGAALIEVGQLRKQLMDLANSRWQGESVFAGTAVKQDAFVADPAGNITYNGNSHDRIVAISPTLTAVSNVRGDGQAFTDAFASLQTLETAMTANDAAGIRGALTTLKTAGDGIIDLNSEVGGRIHTLDLQNQSYQDIESMLAQRLSKHESVDIPATFSKIQQASLALKAIYAEVAKLQNLSLINFLR